MSCGCGKQQSRNVSRLQAQLAEVREHVKRLELTVTLLDEEVGGAAARLASLAEVGLKRKRELDAARAAVDVLVAWVQEGDGCCLDWGEREEHHGACPVGNLPEAVRKRQVQLAEARDERDAAIEDRNRGDCRTNNGSLIEGLECEIDGDPSCFYHYWQQAEDREEGLRKAGLVAQQKWEDWIVDQLEGTSQYKGVLAYAKKNRTALEKE